MSLKWKRHKRSFLQKLPENLTDCCNYFETSKKQNDELIAVTMKSAISINAHSLENITENDSFEMSPLVLEPDTDDERTDIPIVINNRDLKTDANLNAINKSELLAALGLEHISNKSIRDKISNRKRCFSESTLQYSFNNIQPHKSRTKELANKLNMKITSNNLLSKSDSKKEKQQVGQKKSSKPSCKTNEVEKSSESLNIFESTDYNFDLSISNNKCDTDVQIISQNDVVITLLTSSSEVDVGTSQKETDFETQMLRLSPDLFENNENDIKQNNTETDLSQIEQNSMFLNNNILETSTPSKLQPSQISIDMFSDKSSSIEHIHNQNIQVISSDQSNTFEITKNDVFSNIIRIGSESSMSPIRLSDDDEDAQTPPKRPLSCFSGLPVLRRHKTKSLRNEIDFSKTPNASEIDLKGDNEFIDCIPASQITPKRKSKYSNFSKTPNTSNTKKPTSSPGDIRKWLIKRSPTAENNKMSPQTSHKRRRLEFSHITSTKSRNGVSSNAISELNELQILISSDEEIS